MLDSGKIGHQLSSLPLRNNTLCHCIDKVANVVQSQLNDIHSIKQILFIGF